MAALGLADKSAPDPSNIAVAESPAQENPSNVPRGLAVPTSTSLRLHAATSDVLSSLPPPPPFNLRIVNLTVGAPLPSQYLPLPVPIPVPKFLLKRISESDTRPKSIIQDVCAECQAGEMLAMYVCSMLNAMRIMLIRMACRIGGSGSGKTTLLHSIVGRLSNLPILDG